MQREYFESFGLPDMFPASLMPEGGARFVAECRQGMNKAALMRLARSRGFMPTWKRLEHLGPGVYALGLTIGGMGIPVMVRMKPVAESEPVMSARTQASLF